MPSVYEPDNYQGRVNFAAAYVTQGRNTTRHFDTCFEMGDGDLVACALWRRAQRNPKLAEALPRYINAANREDVLARYAHLSTRQLADEAKRQRDEAQRDFNARYGK